MKLVKTIILTCIFCVTVNAQEDYTKSLEGINWVQIESKTDIIVKAHNNNQLLLKGGKMERTPEKAKGLKLVGEGGTDNTNVGFSVEQQGSTLIIRNLRRNGKAEIYLPSTQNISVTSSYLNNIEITGFVGEVEAKAEVVGNITIRDVTGPLTVNSNTGQVEIIFSKFNQNSPTTITTATGNVDVTLPRDTPATVTMNATMGDIYTDFDLGIPEKNGLKAVSIKKTKGTLNGGGGTIQINSATGNIYLRKK